MDIDTVNNVLYITTAQNALVFRCALSTGCDSGVDFTTAFDPGLMSDVLDVVIDAVNGALFIALGDDVYRCLTSSACNETSDFAVVYDDTSGYVWSMAIDEVNNSLYLGNFNGDIIRCILISGCDSAEDYTTVYDTDFLILHLKLVLVQTKSILEQVSFIEEAAVSLLAQTHRPLIL
jgi:hypothetical protein